MPEYRHDALSDHWVIIAPERQARPDQFPSARSRRRITAPCPFCAGREAETPAAVAVYGSRTGAEAEWQVRVVPNKYPAVYLPADAKAAHGDELALPGLGAHEVIIESPAHVVSFSELSDEQAEGTFLAYRDRIRVLQRDPRLAYVQVFKNSGADGGATLEHSHSQLIALAMVPVDLQRRFSRAGEHRLVHGTCFFCEMLAAALDEDSRRVAETEHFVALTPFASRFPYETWIVPRAHWESYAETERPVIAELSLLLRDLIARMERLLDDPAYNYWLHTAPLKPSPHDDYHWHLQLVPRLTRLAGFELGAGCFINSVLPEEAARRLRATSSIVGSSDQANVSARKA